MLEQLIDRMFYIEIPVPVIEIFLSEKDLAGKISPLFEIFAVKPHKVVLPDGSDGLQL